jgi:hypothetical protein
MQPIRACVGCDRTRSDSDPTCATRVALKSLAPHILELGNEIGMLDGLIDVLFSEIGLHSEVRAGLTDPVIFTLRAGRRAGAQLTIENPPEPNTPAVS